jgi:hypothetical protein
VQKVQLNIKFVGDSHVSPYPNGGFGQYVMRRQLKANDCSYYGIILIEEWNLNAITKNGWMEGDLLASRLCDELVLARRVDAALPTTSASCYLLKATGNAVLQVSVWLHLYVCVRVCLSTDLCVCIVEVWCASGPTAAQADDVPC